MNLKRITAFIGALALSLSLTANMTAVQAEGNALSYNITGTAGEASGTVTLNVENTADITDVKLFWGSSATEKLADYKAIKNYTTAEVTEPKNEVLAFTDNALTYEMAKGMLLPNGATHLLAEITKSDATTEIIAAEIPVENRFVDENFLYSMIVLSDVHVDQESPFETSRQNVVFGNMKEYIANSTPERKPKAMILNGDLGDASMWYEYVTLEEILAKHITEIPVYYNTGNHDTTMDYGYDACDEAFEKHFALLEEQGWGVERDDKWSYDIWVEGQHHIFLAYPYANNWGLPAAQKKWLEEKIEEGEKSGAPTFLYVHCPVNNTVSRSENGQHGAVNSEDFNAIMDRHPGVIVFTSHLHNEPDSDFTNFVVNEDTASYADTAAVVYNSGWYGPDSTYTKTSGGNGRILEVYEDKVVLRSLDLVNMIYNPRAECIIPDYGTKLAGNVSVQATDLNAGSTVKALINGEAVNTENYTVEWYVNGVKQEEASNTFTIATADENVSVKVIDKNAENSYAWANTDIRAAFVPETSDSDEGEEEQETQITINGADIEYKKDVVYVTGKFTTADAGKKVLFMIVPESTYTQVETAAYINEAVVKTDGTYTVKFKTGDVDLSADDYVMLTKLEGADVVASNVIEKLDMNGLVEITPSIDEAGIVSLKLKNCYLDSMSNVKLIAAEYDANGRLVKTTMTSADLAFGRQTQSAKFTEALSSANKIKVFMWKDMSSMTPLTSPEEIPVSAAQ